MIKPALQIWAQLLIKILRLLCICLVCYHLSIVEIFFFIFFLISFNFFPCFDVYFLFALVLLFFTWLCVISFVCKTFGYIGYMNILLRLNSLWSLVTWWKQKINHVVFFISIGSLFWFFGVSWVELKFLMYSDVFSALSFCLTWFGSDIKPDWACFTSLGQARARAKPHCTSVSQAYTNIIKSFHARAQACF